MEWAGGSEQEFQADAADDGEYTTDNPESPATPAATPSPAAAPAASTEVTPAGSTAATTATPVENSGGAPSNDLGRGDSLVSVVSTQPDSESVTAVQQQLAALGIDEGTLSADQQRELEELLSNIHDLEHADE